jgi:hypothetical protein
MAEYKDSFGIFQLSSDLENGKGKGLPTTGHEGPEGE